jgi:hypothetical protein
MVSGMLVFLLGLVVLNVAHRTLTRRQAPSSGRRLIAPGLVAVLLVAQVWWAEQERGADGVSRYRITEHGVRFPIAANRHGQPSTVTFGGLRDSVDLLVPGIPGKSFAAVEVKRDTVMRGIDAAVPPDVQGALVWRKGRDTWHVVGARPVSGADTLLVHLPAGVRRLQVRHEGLLRVRHRVVDLDDPQRQVELPRHSGRDAYSRTYPVADVLAAMEADTAAPGIALTSFLHFEDDVLMLADLDSEVALGAERGDQTHRDRVWSPDGGRYQLRAVALPLRDYDDRTLQLPERFGVRTVNSYGISVRGSWLDLQLRSPRVHALTRGALERMDRGRDPTEETWTLRLTANPASLARSAIAFEQLSHRFQRAGEALIEIPRAPGADSFRVRTPAGSALVGWDRQVALGPPGEAALLLRVDRQWAGRSYQAALLLVLAIGVGLFALPMTGGTYPLALAVFSLCGLRTLLALGVYLAYPFVEDAYASALCSLPLATWAVILAAEAGAWWGHRQLRATGLPPGFARDPALLHAGIATALALLGWAFSGGFVTLALPPLLVAAYLAARGKLRFRPPRWRLPAAAGPVAAAVLAASLSPGAPVLFAGTIASAGGAPTAWSRVARPLRLPAWLRILPDASMRRRSKILGLLIAGLAGIRVLAAVMGQPEALYFFGTRFGLSVVYTPAVLVVLALVLDWTGRQGLANDPAHRRTFLLLVLAWLALDIGGVAAAAGDFGIVFTATGAFVVLAYVALLVPPTRPSAGMLWAGLLLPLFLLVVPQAVPSILPGAGTRDTALSEADRMSRWSNTDLRVLERADPEALALLGQQRSEALMSMVLTMRDYTRGPGSFAGRGFLATDVSPELAPTAAREHVPSTLVAGYWGILGNLALLLIFAAMVLPAAAAWPASRLPGRVVAGGSAAATGLLLVLPDDPLLIALWLAAVAGLCLLVRARISRAGVDGGATPLVEPPSLPVLLATLALATVAGLSIYMVLANYGLVFFTGKNVYLLGLESVSDLLESLVLLGMAAACLGYERVRSPAIRTTT